MKSKVLTILTGLLMVTLLFALILSGCGGEAGSFTSLTSLAKMAPSDTNTIFFVDVKSFKSDEIFSELYEEMKDSFAYTINAGSVDDVMSFDDIHYIGTGVSGSGEIIWLTGDFNFEAIREQLKNDDYTQNDYNDVEVWYGSADVIAIHNSTLIIGDEGAVEESVATIGAPEKSVYQTNRDIRDVIGAMSSGLYSLVFIEPFYPGSSAVGISFSKLDADLMKFSGCFKFENNEDAEDTLSVIKSDMEESEFYNVEVRRSGNLAKFSAEINMEEADLFW